MPTPDDLTADQHSTETSNPPVDGHPENGHPENGHLQAETRPGDGTVHDRADISSPPSAPAEETASESDSPDTASPVPCTCESATTIGSLRDDIGEPTATADTDITPEPQSVSRWSRWGRRLVSAWLLYHVAAIIAAPASVSPSSPLAQRSWEWFRPYLQVLYLNHGYHFFAPEPAQSTLVSYTAHLPDGGQITGRFPNRDIHPRLLYHRHFMLTEFFNFAPDDPERPWYRTYATHLARKHNATHVSLTRITHYLPTMGMVLDGVPLDNPASYAEQPLGTFANEE